MRRFNVESLSAGEAQRRIELLPIGDCDRWLRASRLLLHWWAVGHDFRRALNRCKACDGRTVMWSKYFKSWLSCHRCAGSGRRSV